LCSGIHILTINKHSNTDAADLQNTKSSTSSIEQTHIKHTSNKYSNTDAADLQSAEIFVDAVTVVKDADNDVVDVIVGGGIDVGGVAIGLGDVAMSSLAGGGVIGGGVGGVKIVGGSGGVSKKNIVDGVIDDIGSGCVMIEEITDETVGGGGGIGDGGIAVIGGAAIGEDCIVLGDVLVGEGADAHVELGIVGIEVRI
jgi:hypothetical protein